MDKHTHINLLRSLPFSTHHEDLHPGIQDVHFRPLGLSKKSYKEETESLLLSLQFLVHNGVTGAGQKRGLYWLYPPPLQ